MEKELQEIVDANGTESITEWLEQHKYGLFGYKASLFDQSKLRKLSKIIKGKTTRLLFEKYLKRLCVLSSNPSRIHHPNDIRQLDRFICALSRFRCNLDISELEGYLIRVWDGH